jgi:hypothetical protein
MRACGTNSLSLRKLFLVLIGYDERRARAIAYAGEERRLSGVLVGGTRRERTAVEAVRRGEYFSG